ncbi:L-serine ammonia-lyase, iron-sulfur-dependent subunit beta [Paenibacillus aurantius]|uniref:L-serine deaminase n=1 Tax=Paenibacillus aurantius TaxID=2918900 RepID=A0AA96LC35_9BACL|nr:L-serine ammonia-lyase, iron-sulfur-dependent subunit beta [Paenibacillus aurantius]WNQ10369.1 L-serine ammonia-lyase, iron-sulfur-dependent subunit beta [Paenibacillus aurantius]
MRFKDVFSIIGPDMVGPSSSHTAGAVRIGRAARQFFGPLPERVEITLFRSFAETYRGHGTDVALAAGLLDWDTQDERIPEALQHAAGLGVNIEFFPAHGDFAEAPHPNTARLRMTAGDRTMTVTGTSIGGGNIEIVGVDGFDVRCSCSYPTLAIYHDDRVGMLADITRLISQCSLNIGHMDVDRASRSGKALTLIEADGRFEKELVEALRALPGVTSIRTVDLTG